MARLADPTAARQGLWGGAARIAIRPRRLSICVGPIAHMVYLEYLLLSLDEDEKAADLSVGVLPRTPFLGNWCITSFCC